MRLNIWIVIGAILIVIGLLLGGTGILGIAPQTLVDDAYVDTFDMDMNYNNDELRSVWNTYGTSHVFIKFNINLAQNITINSATMKLGYKKALNFQGTEPCQALGYWNEETITWNDQPPIDCDPMDYDDTFEKTPGSPYMESGLIQYDVKDIVKNWVNGDTNFGFAIVAYFGTDVIFFSKENLQSLNPPKLLINFTDANNNNKDYLVTDDYIKKNGDNGDNDFNGNGDDDNDKDNGIWTDVKDVGLWVWVAVAGGIMFIFGLLINRKGG